VNSPEHSFAFGAPGITPRWTSSAKEGLGTAYHTSCRVWFTLSHGIVNEIYYPTVDQPNTRDFQLLISDGETFCHEEKRDLDHRIEYPERDCPFYRLTNSERGGRYRLIKHVLTDPHRSVLLVHNKIEVLDQSLRGKLHLYALLAPHIARQGAGNSGRCSEVGGKKLFHAERNNVHLVMGCSAGFSRRSVGFVGASDGWQDLMDNFKMDWEFHAAENGNIALTGEINLPDSDEFAIAIALGGSYQSTVAKLLQSLAEPFSVHREGYVRQWQRTVINPTAFLIRHGPVTAQDRWEESAGYSPSTLATVIAGLVCAAEFAQKCEETGTAEFILEYADWLATHVEEWTVTTCGELVEGFPRYYIRINPTDLQTPDPHADPNTTILAVANGGGLHPARNIVGGDFLHLVRLGIRAASDPIVRDSLEVIDRVLKRDLPQGPGWRRYNYDGYGQKHDGSAFDGTGIGRSWPILTGERGHYELAAGRDLMPFIVAMERFANAGGMISEQLWDAAELPKARMRRGQPTGAAMPLCWSHAEYVSLVRSAHDGICFDRVEPAFQRYVVKPVRSPHEIWSFRHPSRRMYPGKILRIIVTAEAAIIWSTDGWASTNTLDTINNSTLNLWFADLSTEHCSGSAMIEFTFFWKQNQRWEGRNYSVAVSESK
jgi:GH15 family glucan-1,4-alpha-glucosidase